MDLEKVREFVAKNNCKPRHDIDKDLTSRDDNEEQAYRSILPLEQHMRIEPDILEDYAWENLERDDIVICRVKSKTDHRLFGYILCYDGQKSQHIKEYAMRIECLRSEIPSGSSHDNPLFQFAAGDLIRARVLTVERREEIVEITLRKHKDQHNVSLGLVSDEDFPLLYSNEQKHKTYDELLQTHPGFLNPNAVDCLKDMLIDKPLMSLVACLDNLSFPERQCATSLRKNQSKLLADKSVAKGLKFLKRGKVLESLQEFNHALQMDTSHVDALIARGALFANERTFAKAIADFEFAVSLEPDNDIAKSSLVQVLLERAKTISENAQDDAQIKEVRGLYKKALRLDPRSEATKKASLRFENELTKRRKRKSISSSDSDDDKNATIVKFCQLLKSDIGSSKKKKHKSRKRSSSSKHRSSESEGSDDSFKSKKHSRTESIPKKSKHPSEKKSKPYSEHVKERRSSHSGDYPEKSNKPDKYRRHSESSSKRNLNKSNFEHHEAKKLNSPERKQKDKSAPITNVNKSTFQNILDQINQFEGKRKSI